MTENWGEKPTKEYNSLVMREGRGFCCERHPIPSGYGFNREQGRTWTTAVQVVKGKENPMRHIGANKFVMHRTLD